MIHATPFGYPPQTPAERHQDAAEAILAAQDAEFVAVRFEEGPSASTQQDAVQAIIGHCLQARDEIANREQSKFGMLCLIGYCERTFQSILEECRRIT